MMSRLQVLVLVGLFAFVSSAEAFTFVPKDSEWAAWPPHC
jgi:hypothetical protein